MENNMEEEFKKSSIDTLAKQANVEDSGSQRAKLLIVEPNDEIREKIRQVFIDTELYIEETNSITKAIAMLDDSPFDIVISEMQTQNATILDLARVVKEKHKDTYLLLWTKESNITTLFKCYQAGVDSINSKNRPPILVKAKVMAMIRRINSWKARALSPKVVRYGKIEIDKESRLLWVDGKRMSVTNKEFTILKYLLDNMNKIITKEDLKKELVSGDKKVSGLDVYIHRLRRKVGKCIFTVRGTGYMLREELI